MHLPTRPRAFLAAIDSGPKGVYQTLRIMRYFVRTGKKDMLVRQKALSIIKNRPQKDFAGEVQDLHKFVRDSIRYVKDIAGVETVQTPDITLEIGQGDCDDKSVLLASLLESIGHPTRFVAVGFRPGHFSHVLIETKIGARWIPLETTEPVPMGWYPPRVRARMEVFNR